MEGLAQQMAGVTPTPPQPASQPMASGGGLPTVEEIITMLLDGKHPEELIKMGIPPELIMQAIEILEQEMKAQGQPRGASPEAGLAQSMAGM